MDGGLWTTTGVATGAGVTTRGMTTGGPDIAQDPPTLRLTEADTPGAAIAGGCADVAKILGLSPLNTKNKQNH
jgi:hypothetical protein